MRLDRRWIAERIPHHGRMCLLDEVVAWSVDHVQCRTQSHRDAENPLRAQGRLGIACGIEYAAQAVAVHAALLAAAAPSTLARREAPAAGLLAALRNVEMRAARLDDVPGELQCTARRLAGTGHSALYAFELSSAAACLLRGRATVLLQTEKP